MARRNETTAGDPSAPAKKASGNHPVVTVYLIVYNLLSSIAWGHILFRLSVHMLTAPVPSSTSYFASIKFYKSPLPSVLLAVLNSLAPSLVPYAERASGAFAVIGAETKWVQSVAVLEIVHAALGFVRSPTGMTAAQVSGRLVLLWGVADRFATARANPLYASMVFAWSLTEVIRYLFYVSSLAASPPYALLWARYTTFYALYPIGGVSEALIVFFTLPWKNWGLSEWVRGALFLVWLPGLYVLYTHMLGQRRRVLGDGKGKTLGSKKTR
ncbi:PTPLA-domain-containing protein [Athelia psychrophila]|uniref:Very-long-chain (3R)-3-hydroxyacyl-CoA dehydratase n=1 Tax=Athelia psychrophila TaxID=1759441 RepID=A0A166AHH1_9AGAM|nr:PTPLA-domain-containing protein [Fibularhizoctonia sp. CBS 109695]